MTGNPFGTPVSQLALEMAVRNQQLAERVPAMVANQRELINRRLTRFGGDISQYEPFMDVGYQPTANALRSQAEQMRDYLVGMPELMAKAMKEGQKSGVTYKAPGVLSDFDLAAQEKKARDIAQASDSFRPVNIISSQPQTQAPAATYRPPNQGSRLRPVSTSRSGGPKVSFR